MMEGCIFCKIARGEIPCAKVYESDKALAFLDIQPVNEGHTLVIPKEHYETLIDIPEELLAEMSSTVKMVSSMVKNGMKAHGFNVMMNNNEAAGQVVPHAHFHIVPRFKGDGLRLWEGKKVKTGDIEKTKEAITAYMQI
jgi:histidine triad (HIT) family protein